MARIVLNPFGSLGDLHPYLALALALRPRGHHVTVATSAVYRDKIEAEGLAFTPVRPDAGELLHRPELMTHLLDQRRGTEFLLRDYLIPQVRAAFDDLMPACRGADLLVTHVAAFAGPIVAEVLRLPWVSVALQPATLFSRHDPLVVAKAPWLRHLYWLGPRFADVLFKFADVETRRWARPIFALRRDLDLPNDTNPVLWGHHSPHCVLALFSRHFAPPQPDWPLHTTQTGFVFYDSLGSNVPAGNRDAAQLEQFLLNGDPPLLFTLGSSAVLQPGDFFRESIAAARQLQQRAIVLVGPHVAIPDAADPHLFFAAYLPFSQVMPRAAAIVHSGGIGTTAQALRAGRPMLVVPWSNDQPDNAYRLQKLGVARVLPRTRYRAKSAAALLESLLQNASLEQSARRLSAAIQSEDSLTAACDAIESVLAV